jgi:hypothetical protein
VRESRQRMRQKKDLWKRMTEVGRMKEDVNRGYKKETYGRE